MRDPLDARSNNALGLLSLRRGFFSAAEGHFRTALARLTRRNPNPADGEPAYNLGLALKYQDRLQDAYAALYKATWNYAWRAPAYYLLATIDSMRGDFDCGPVASRFGTSHERGSSESAQFESRGS